MPDFSVLLSRAAQVDLQNKNQDKLANSAARTHSNSHVELFRGVSAEAGEDDEPAIIVTSPGSSSSLIGDSGAAREEVDVEGLVPKLSVEVCPSEEGIIDLRF